jgi:ATP-dependent Lon protease
MTKRTVLLWTAALLAAGPLVMWGADAFERPDVRPVVAPTGPGTPTSHPSRFSLTEQQENDLLAVLKETQPENHRRLLELKKSSPDRFRWAMRAMWPWYQRYKSMPKEAQKAMLDEQDAKVEIWRIVEALPQAKDPAERAKLTSDLREAVSKQFGADQVLREYRLTELEQQIKRLREELQQRREQREQILKDRVEEWLRASTQPHERRMSPPTRPAGPHPPEGQ